MPLVRFNRREMSEKLWKWRYKLQHLGSGSEKTLSDFSSAEPGDSSGKRKPTSATPGTGGNNNKNGELGASVSVKTLYEGPNSRGDVYNWVDYPPKQLTKSAARAQDRVAIKVFKIKDPEKPIISGRFSLRYHMLEVQNPLLVAALGEILEKQDIHLDTSENASFKYPFPELYFGYDDIVAKHRSLGEEEPTHPLLPFLLLLIRLLDDIFADTRAKLKALRAAGLVSFKLAWTLFPRNRTVVSWGNNCELLCKVTSATYESFNGSQVLIILGRVLRFDGRVFLWEDFTIRIDDFGGNRPITELPAYPLELHEAAGDVRTRLTARGRKVLDYQGLTYAHYSGIAIHSSSKATERHNVEGRVLIDVVGYNKHHLAQGAREGSDPQSKKRQLVVGDDDDSGGGRGITGSSGTSAGAGALRLSVAAQERNKLAMLALEAEEPLLMYMLPLVQGYALKNKLWVSFYVEDIGPVVWNDEAYDHLVYNEQQKDLVMSFVESHCGGGGGGPAQKRTDAMQDVIAGKGQGLVILLSGPPGTGKTLMAEAVADRTRRPLFYLQAEDLGINAAALGANIKKVFQMATEWDAVILLDEADVFMAERHPQDIARNELVSIFLRELEYFRGIIFLTTNLYSTIDSAFRSRVSLHLLFHSLTPEARMLIWRKFLDRLPPPLAKAGPPLPGRPDPAQGDPAEQQVVAATDQERDGVLTDADIKELAAWQLNGREIKTAVKMTKTWCDHKGYALSLSRLENGIKVTSPHATKSSKEYDTSLYDE
ncbi:8e91407e-3944-4112-816d-64ed6737502f [Thermothielavioides terrestris]|uniref:8e91407e-3944-4112-816d-64ed6737502f n=1 Tax=Thermothielavioides terrestris TaxID=2587410 RepID=A0A3S4AQS1_9PEZI|nr:8e91407e-3944-4112-816d-64ed6737502f [Thermothielavioides terrestris]